MTTRLSRGLCLFGVLSLSVSTAVGCAANLAQYPEAGEPGPVVTAGGDTIPEGPDRDAFMAGYHLGFERADEAAMDGEFLRVLGGAAGGFTGGLYLPWVANGGFVALPLVAGGVGLIALAATGGVDPPMTRLPASVVDRGPLFEDGYREGYFQGLQSRRQRAALIGGGLGAIMGLILALGYSST